MYPGRDCGSKLERHLRDKEELRQKRLEQEAREMLINFQLTKQGVIVDRDPGDEC